MQFLSYLFFFLANYWYVFVGIGALSATCRLIAVGINII